MFSDAGNTVVDKVGMGTAADNESADATVPSASGSIQRKIDDTGGHGTDSDNNSNDFEALVVSEPRNSSFIVSTATPSPTESPTSTATATPTATPTSTATSTPTETPTSIPSVTPTASPTSSPSSTGFPFPFKPLVFTCRVTYVTFNFRWFVVSLPQILCGWNL